MGVTGNDTRTLSNPLHETPQIRPCERAPRPRDKDAILRCRPPLREIAPESSTAGGPKDNETLRCPFPRDPHPAQSHIAISNRQGTELRITDAGVQQEEH